MDVDLSAPPLAHELWFEEDRYPTDWGFAGETTTLLPLVWGSDPQLRPLVSAFPWQWRARVATGEHAGGRWQQAA